MKGCDTKDEYVERLMKIAEEHYEITSVLAPGIPMSPEMRRDCNRLRAAWEQLRDQMERHQKEHGC